MKQQYFKYTLVFLMLMTGFIYKADAQNVQAEAKLDKTTIKIGDQTQLRLIVHQQAKEQVNFPKLADTLTSKIQIVAAAKADTLADKSNPNQLTVTQTYTITSFDSGSYLIPPFAFGSKAGVLKTNDLNLVVQAVQVDTTKAIYDIKQPLAVSYTFFDWLRDHWVWVAAGLLLILAIIGIIFYLKKRPKKQEIAPEVKIYIPPHTEALNKLHELRGRKLWQQGEVKAYHSEISDVMREYLEKRYVIKTQEKTTDEIFAGIKYLSISEEDRNILRQILLLADLVKFAKEKPLPAENELSIDNAVSFIIHTQQVAEVKEKAEGGSENEPV